MTSFQQTTDFYVVVNNHYYDHIGNLTNLNIVDECLIPVGPSNKVYSATDIETAFDKLVSVVVQKPNYELSVIIVPYDHVFLAFATRS